VAACAINGENLDPELGALAVFLTQQRPAWMADARCAEPDAPSRMFFGERGSRKLFEQAVALCGRCLVKRECLHYALAEPALEGVWGGTSHKERERLRRKVASESPAA
jgi:WhiB family redox-sensing transcriptional regulator